jgi:glycosyltransferase involved in cell wall biosynthesis
VERHRKASKNPVAGKYFLSVSRFIKRKNLSRLIDAYALYRKNSDRTAWGLVLCGCGPEESSLRRRVKEGNISGVIFTGALKPDELCRYLAFAEAYVHPAYSEQWGLSVNEAMAAGKPILISSTCGCRYDLVKDGENGILFDPYNIAQLSVLMSGLAKGEYDLSRMGKASREIIGQWGPELFANSTRLLIDKII